LVFRYELFFASAILLTTHKYTP